MTSDGRIEVEKHTQQRGDVEIETIESEIEDYESSPIEYEIQTFPADYTLEGLHEKWKSGDISIPKFQRQFVWKQVQASKLVESFLLGLPVPAIFLYTERKSQKYLVIDGQQRLRSVFYFFDGVFGEESKGKKTIFRLKGLGENSKWFNKRFEDFDDADKRKLKNCVLRAFIVQQLDPKDDTSIYHIFERLNTGGTLLTNQEVRNCVFGGNLNNLLTELNNHLSWRGILGTKKPDSRQKDIELILRFFALYETNKYDKKPLKDHLSVYMKHHRNLQEEIIKENKEIFTKACETVLAKLGEKPFHVKRGLNAAVYDSVMVAFSKNVQRVPHDIKKRYKDLLKDDTYNMLISRSTTDVDNVRKRFALAHKILFKD